MHLAKIKIEIVYAHSFLDQYLMPLELTQPSTIYDAIQQSQCLQKFPEIDLDYNKVGIFGKLKSLKTALQNGDRVEIYRPLLLDPKENRRIRVKIKHPETNHSRLHRMK